MQSIVGFISSSKLPLNSWGNCSSIGFQDSSSRQCNCIPPAFYSDVCTSARRDRFACCDSRFWRWDVSCQIVSHFRVDRTKVQDSKIQDSSPLLEVLLTFAIFRCQQWCKIRVYDRVVDDGTLTHYNIGILPDLHRFADFGKQQGES